MLHRKDFTLYLAYAHIIFFSRPTFCLSANLVGLPLKYPTISYLPTANSSIQTTIHPETCVNGFLPGLPASTLVHLYFQHGCWRPSLQHASQIRLLLLQKVCFDFPHPPRGKAHILTMASGPVQSVPAASDSISSCPRTLPAAPHWPVRCNSDLRFPTWPQDLGTCPFLALAFYSLRSPRTSLADLKTSLRSHLLHEALTGHSISITPSPLTLSIPLPLYGPSSFIEVVIFEFTFLFTIPLPHRT